MTPYEAWTGDKPNVNNLRIFGCNAYAHVPKDERGKMDLKTKRCIFLGYGETTNGYRLYYEEKRRVFFCRDVVFDETMKLKVILGERRSRKRTSRGNPIT